MQREGDIARQDLASAGDRLFEPAETRPQGPVEPGFLAGDDVDDQVVLAHQGRPRLTKDAGRRVHQRRPDGLVDPEPACRHHRAPHDAAQHIAPALVGRQYAIGDQHGHGPRVVGQDAQRHVGPLVGPVAAADDGGRRVDDRQEQVGIEHRILSLEDWKDPLEPGTGVDVLSGEVGQLSRLVPVELHEDEVPHLDEAVAAAVLRPAVVPVLGPLVDEDLRVGATGTGLAHGPEIVLVAHALEALGAQADRVDPDLLGLVVVVVHRHPEAVTIEAEHLGEELPGHRDGLGFEVVAEAEVPQHLEESAVVRVGADDLDVGGPEALLNGGGPGPRGRLLAQEVRLEGHHPRDGEEDRGVVRDEAGGGDDAVAALRKEARKGRPQSVGVHPSSLPGAKTDPGPAQADDMPTMGWLRRMPPVDP